MYYATTKVEEAQGLRSDFDCYLEVRTAGITIYICGIYPSTTVRIYPIKRKLFLLLFLRSALYFNVFFKVLTVKHFVKNK